MPPKLTRLLPLLLMLPASAELADTATTGIGKDEFPGLQFLPVGSVVKGINIPRYEQHRAASLMTADAMEILTRKLVRFTRLKASMYDPKGYTTTLFSEVALYDFRKKRAYSDHPTRVKDPRFSASGKGAAYSTETRKGIIRGPVHSTVNLDVLQSRQDQK